MTSAAFIGTQLFYFLLGAVTLWDYFRWRDRPRLVVALTFVSFGGFILTQDLMVTNPSLPGVYALNRFLLALHPFLLVLLINYFQPVPRWMRWVAAGGLALVTLVDWIFGGINNGGTGLLIILYFVFFESYAAVLTVRGAFRSNGVTRRRLGLAAAGTGALALGVVYLVFAIFIQPLQAGIGWIVPIASSLAAICQYLGFATPNWLREPWQLAELYKFLHQLGGRAIDERTELALDELCRVGARASGGEAAAIALAEPGSDKLSLHAPAEQNVLHGALPSLQGAIARAWANGQPQVATARADFGLPAETLAAVPEADTLLVVPIQVSGQRWGLLLVFRRGQSPFVAADLRLLGLLADQVAQSLEYSALIGQLRQRTSQLELANKELESFSYSVSHDLRAPLRAMDGFSLALNEDYGHLLPAEAKGYLTRIRAAAQRMGELVDDLLNLSQVSRAEMRSQPVDLSALAQAVLDDLRQAEPGRVITIVLAPGILATGDARLLRLVLTNLLGNAWKFTGKRDNPTIEFGTDGADSEHAYFVRDNGAGFDMAYANRLFGVFQRLHQATDFPGTGIGLATVQRIVQRHGGRIWAVAELDKGATFFFTLAAPVSPAATEATL